MEMEHAAGRCAELGNITRLSIFRLLVKAGKNVTRVKEGDRVTKGQKIAEMGVTNAGQPLLHFEIRRDGKPVDPVRLLPRG